MPTVTISDNTTGLYIGDYTGTEDTHIKEASATTNYGSSTSPECAKYAVSDHTHMLISFSGLSSISPTVAVSSATMYLYVIGSVVSGTQTHSLRRLLVSFTEAQATWNIRATSTNWTTAGGLSNGNDRSSTLTADFSVNSTIEEFKSATSAQLASDVEDKVNGTVSNNGWHLERTDGANDSTYCIYGSSEYTNGSRPALVFTYTTGTTISCTVDNLTLSTYSSVINATTNIAAGVSNLTLTAYPAIVSTTTDTNINAGVNSLTLTTYQSIINATRNITSSTVPLTVTTYPATVTLDVGTNIQVGTVSLSLSTYRSTVIGVARKTGGGLSLTEEEYYRLEKQLIKEQKRLRMIALDDDEILSII